MKPKLVSCDECKAVVGHYCRAREGVSHDIECAAQFHGCSESKEGGRG